MNVYEELMRILKDNNFHISAAESCTAGMFISDLVSVSGASDVLGASYITYSVEAKIDTVGVKKDTIDTFGVVSENVAIEMAVGAAKKSGADVGVGITGYAGPATDENDTTAGTVCFGFYVDGRTLTATRKFPDMGRNVVRELACMYAAEALIKLIRVKK